MRITLAAFTLLALGLAAPRAEAQSCSSFVQIKGFDAAAKTVSVSYERGSQARYFPKPEGATTETTKIPNKCPGKVTRHTDLAVEPTGGRMTVTQIRSNFEGRMLNDTEDAAWLPARLEKLKADETTVVAVIRPGKKRTDTPELTTIYLPITEEEKQEIARIDAQAEEVD